MQNSSSNLETRIDWLHAPDPWVVFMVLVPGVILATWWIYRRETSHFDFWKRLLLTTLRVAAILLICAFLFEPMLVRERVEKENSHILFLVDDSYSMGITDRYSDPASLAAINEITGGSYADGMTRLDIVKRTLSNQEFNLINRLREKGNVRLLTFSNNLKQVGDYTPIDPGDADSTSLDFDAETVNLRGKITNIGDAIYDAVNELRGETVSAIVMVSDGRDNGGGLRPEEAAERLGRREVPIFPVGIGNADEPRDIRVFGLDVAEKVLENDVVPVDFQVISQGFEGQVRVELSLIPERGRARRPEFKYIRLEKSEEPQTHRIEFQPKFPGKFTVRVEIPVQDGELFEDNNFDDRQITVLSGKIKVLFVDGPPRFEYRYLSHALTRDPTMQAHVLLTSADPQFLQLSSPGLSPIDRFPSSKEQLLEYNVVILGDVHPDTLSERQKEWLVEFVDDYGGGIVFMSGMWHMPQKYRGTVLERLLPIVLDDSGSAYFGAANLTDEFFLSLTPEGQKHPVMQLVADTERNLELWEEHGPSSVRLPGLYWYAKVESLRRGAVPLAVHSRESNIKDEPRPIFAYQYFGRGRTFVSLTDETWRWRLGVGNRYFYRFWGQVIRFVAASRLGEKTRYSISTDQQEYTLGSSVSVLARVLDNNLKPLTLEEYTIHYERLDEEGEPVPESRGEISAIQTLGRPEFFEANFETRELGQYRMWIEDRESEKAQTNFRVVVPQLEFAQPRMDRSRLERLAELSGGRYYEIAELQKLPNEISTYQLEVAVPAENRSLWDSRWLLLLFVAILSTEWLLRKLFRLV